MNHYRINDIKLAIDEPKKNILRILGSKLKLRSEDIFKWEIRRRSIDARDKGDVHFVYAIDVWTEKDLLRGKKVETKVANAAGKQKSGHKGENANNRNVTVGGNRPTKIHGLSVQYIDDGAESETKLVLGDEEIKGRPVVVGMGPCGLFAALELAKHGYRPLVIERGPEMKDRIKDVEAFRNSGLLNPEGNMLFGEGGAGTFSDGKIGTGIKDGNIRTVLRTFADAGAGDEIMYLNKPHIGTDVLRSVIVELRNKVIELGGEVRFNTRLDGLVVEDSAVQEANRVDNNNESDCDIEKSGIHASGKLLAIDVTSNSGIGISCEQDVHERIETNALILALGHSARDTFAMINESGISMQQKAFSIGVRMEHPQAMIDESQYGPEAIAKYGELLPPADYKLSCKTSNGRGVYSFCMCPGGEVVVCTTAEGELCVNGMSNRKRDSGTANSGILCDVRVEDYNGGDETDVLAGVRFQEKYEKLAYENGMRCRRKPASIAIESEIKREKQAGVDTATQENCSEVRQSMRFNPPNCSMQDFLSGTGADAESVIASLPKFASASIREAIPQFAGKISGYDNPDAIVTAVETRSSSPVRILRDEHGESSISGIYPAGEGAGYAGGITSAACDGIRAARNMMQRFGKLSQKNK